MSKLTLSSALFVSLSLVGLVACDGGGASTTNNGGSSQGGGGAAQGGGGAGGGGAAQGGGGAGGGGAGGGGAAQGGGGAAQGGGGAAQGGGGAAQGGGGAGGSGGPCGGFAGLVCEPGFYCDYADETCGAGDMQGDCKPSPGACPDVYAPVCGCDQMVYGNDCDAAAAGVDVAPADWCTAPQGLFPCGAHYCQVASDMCVHTTSDVVGIPDSYSCAPLPQPCQQVAVPSCTCAASAANQCGGQCSLSPEGGVVIDCPGG
jgi:hypothetical protein